MHHYWADPYVGHGVSPRNRALRSGVSSCNALRWVFRLVLPAFYMFLYVFGMFCICVSSVLTRTRNGRHGTLIGPSERQEHSPAVAKWNRPECGPGVPYVWYVLFGYVLQLRIVTYIQSAAYIANTPNGTTRNAVQKSARWLRMSISHSLGLTVSANGQTCIEITSRTCIEITAGRASRLQGDRKYATQRIGDGGDALRRGVGHATA